MEYQRRAVKQTTVTRMAIVSVIITLGSNDSLEVLTPPIASVHGSRWNRFAKSVVTSITVTATAAATATATASTPSSSLQAVFAQSLGGVMFAGAVLLYTPILEALWKNGEGMSFQTWVFNTMGLQVMNEMKAYLHT